jgi:hypothetical protein
VAAPSWLAGTFAAIMIVTAAYCAGRLVIARTRHRATEHDVDLVHMVMGVAMAGMLVPRIDPLWGSAWAVVFGAAAAWFGWRVFQGYRLGRPDKFAHASHVPHLVMSGAMVYMLVASPKPGPGPGSAGSGATMGGPAGGAAHFPLAALVLALFMLGYVMWVADRLPALAPVRTLIITAHAMTAGLYPAAGGGAPVPLVAAEGSRAAALASPDRADRGLPVPLSPRLAACCEIAMGVTMGYMLITML